MEREKIYFRLPIWLQNLSVSAVGWGINQSRYNHHFSSILKEYENHLGWDQSQIERYRNQRLRNFIVQAYRHVPYYQKIFDQQEIDVDEIQELDDLSVLPVLSKDGIKANYSEIVSRIVPSRNQVKSHTSGTTGSGLKFLTTKNAQREQWAVWWRYRRHHGIQRGTRCGYFGGRAIVPPQQDTPPFWRYDHPRRRILFSVYHINQNSISAYIAEIRQQQPPWLHGYPSVISLLASYIIEQNTDLGYQLDWISTGAENLSEKQKNIITKAFGIHPIQNYGLAEGTANFSQCRNGVLHVDEDYAAVEFLPLPDRSGYKVIGTNLTNPAMPMIRYETGDIVQFSNQTCDCGLPGRIVDRVDGRKEDYILLKDGTRVGRMDHIFKDLDQIREAQIYQNYPGRIQIKIVPTEKFSHQDLAQIDTEIKMRFGEKIDYEIVHVNEIERTAAGKLRFVVSDLS